LPFLVVLQASVGAVCMPTTCPPTSSSSRKRRQYRGPTTR
jgi:hypothetical protein